MSPGRKYPSTTVREELVRQSMAEQKSVERVSLEQFQMSEKLAELQSNLHSGQGTDANL